MSKEKDKKAEEPSADKKRPLGRPSIYSEEIISKLFEQMAEGKSIRSICLAPDMPNVTTVIDWITTKPDFSKRYETAKEIRAEMLADSLIELSEEPPERTAAGSIDGGSVQDKRLRIDTRKWIAAKILPKKYGDKIETTLQGPDGGSIKVDTTISAEDAYLKMLGKV